MGKKLKINDLKVKSFVTDVNQADIKGGKDHHHTEFSCYRYVSCFEFQCFTRNDGKYCKI